MLLLQRRNHLDHILGAQSRHATGTMHCLRDCDPFSLNTSVRLPCNSTLLKLDEWESSTQAFDLEFSRWGGRGRALTLDYEALLKSAKGWADALELFGFPREDACYMSSPRQKRVQQTQREMITNWDELEGCVRGLAPSHAHLLRPDARRDRGRRATAENVRRGGARVARAARWR